MEKIFAPCMPDLGHLSSVQLGLQLLDSFDYEILAMTFRRILKGEMIPLPKQCEEPRPAKRQRTLYSPGMNTLLYITMFIEEERLANENIEEHNLKLIQCRKVHEKMCRIPYYLRRRVMQAVHGLHHVSDKWRRWHMMLLKLPEDLEFTFYWRPDGSVDEIKTAHEIVMNSKIDIVKRFRLACLYSLEEDIESLWHQMEASCETENLKNGRISMVRFWDRRMRDGCVDPWKKAVRKHFWYRRNRRGEVRFGTFLPSLPQEERRIFMFFLKYAQIDDLRKCMYSLSPGEEERVLYSDRFCPGDLLSSYLQWPLQSCFLETAEKMLHYIDKNTFYRLLNDILHAMHARKDFDYATLLESFWHLVPGHLREAMKEGYYSTVNIHFWSERVRRKQRESQDVEDKFFNK